MKAGFRDRHDAGRQLADAVRRVLAGAEVATDVGDADADRQDDARQDDARQDDAAANILVLALPRGGVPVAAEVARVLGAPLDLWLVGKLGVPGHEELAMGAMAYGGECYLNSEEIQAFGVAQADIDWAVLQEIDHLERLNQRYRRGAEPPDVAGRTVVVVDDGVATGATMEAAVASLRKAGARRILVAAPVWSRQSRRTLSHDADAVVCLLEPESFFAVGQWYDDFTQTSDDEVVQALQGSR
jgi:predicted phosphoribosyltransferase